jgi:hypothetical protein
VVVDNGKEKIQTLDACTVTLKKQPFSTLYKYLHAASLEPFVKETFRYHRHHSSHDEFQSNHFDMYYSIN